MIAFSKDFFASPKPVLAVTQWFPMSTPPVRAGWYEVTKGGIVCYAKWSYSRRGRFYRFNRFEKPKPPISVCVMGWILGEVTQWRGLAERVS